VVSSADDNTESLGFDAQLLVMEVHRSRKELVELRYVWRTKRPLFITPE
jgi:hypothetical protein